MTKLGRNDPCSCGSGKKYKQCCLKNTPPFGTPKKIKATWLSAPKASTVDLMQRTFGGATEVDSEKKEEQSS